MHHLLPRKYVTKKDNFSYLLFSLLFLLFSSATVEQFLAGSALEKPLLMGLTAISMSISMWSLRSSYYVFNTALGLLLASVIFSLIIIELDNMQLDFIHLLFMLYFFIMTLRLAARQALFTGKVTSNNIIGSICIFLLLGLIWAILYLLLIEFTEMPFSGVVANTQWQENLLALIYFSFVTLTTLGFGDLLPLSPLARFLVYIEAIVGVFYMAIVVSSLVSSGLENKQSKKH